MAKRPPSSGTSGRRSGGSTGRQSRIIHSGRLFGLTEGLDDLQPLEQALLALDRGLGLGLGPQLADRAPRGRCAASSLRMASAPMSSSQLPVGMLVLELPPVLVADDVALRRLGVARDR